VEGNLKAEVKTNMTAKLLDALGIDPARFRLEWVSAGEGSRFAGIVKEFTDTLKKLGPTPLLIAHQQQAASAASSEQEETGGS
jgi:F420-non-reducing hydrogenase iron-sulfur subunit